MLLNQLTARTRTHTHTHNTHNSIDIPLYISLQHASALLCHFQAVSTPSFETSQNTTDYIRNIRIFIHSAVKFNLQCGKI